MSALNETPKANRIRIAFFGLRNAGKSTLVNEFTGQELSIVSDVAGTTTDPVSKAIEIPPLGPCLVTDTAGLDEESGSLGEMRVKKTLDVLALTDIAVWVDAGISMESSPQERKFRAECGRRKIHVLEYRRGDSVEDLKRRIAAVDFKDAAPRLLEGLVSQGSRVLCVCPIDSSAPKGRLILPQVQVIRECLDAHAVCVVCQTGDIPPKDDFDLVIADSQAFASLKGKFRRLTGFSVLFARQKGDLDVFARGLEAVGKLRDGDKVLIAEGCSHHRGCDDIGRVKIPAAVKKLSGRNVSFVFVSGNSFPSSLDGISLVVHCGGCMLTRREMMSRLEKAGDLSVPVVNYGLLLAAAAGLDVGQIRAMFPERKDR